MEKVEIEVHHSASDEHVSDHNAVKGYVPEHASGNGDQYGNNEDGMRRSLRRRTFTEKGHQPQVKDMKRADSFKMAMEKAGQVEITLLIEDVSIKEIQLLYSHWMTLHEVFLGAQDEYSQLLTDEEDIIDNQVSLQLKSDQVQRFKTLVKD